MEKQLLLGDEAIAQGAIDGGMSGIYAYPGTPSTEITEFVQHNTLAREKNIHREWSANEKTAMEAAIGMSYAGKRAMVCMKHVGLNVAADAFINSAITGVNGGLVITVADDPSMHSSQNEQDSRFYGDFSMIPMLEPHNQQEAYDMAYAAFELSEKTGLPVMIRITTRLAHSRAGVFRSQVKAENNIQFPDDPKQFILLPGIARNRYKQLLESQQHLLSASELSSYNKFIPGNNNQIGIISCGIAINYLMENYPNKDCPYNIISIGQYPIPEKMIGTLHDKSKALLVLEEGYPFLEKQLRGLLNNGKKIHGRLDGTLPRDGELTPALIGKALGHKGQKGPDTPKLVRMRPPELCKGCSHRDVYYALNEVMSEIGDRQVFSDIGCYTLGALPPYNAINTCVDMGASITMAKGAADAGIFPAVSVIGDSTFTHSGITGLLDAVNEKSPITVIISDNSTTAMTGGQDSPGTGRLEKICEGIGVDKEHIRIIEPLKKNHQALVDIMKAEFNFKGVSVIIAQRECIQTLAKKKKNTKK